MDRTTLIVLIVFILSLQDHFYGIVFYLSYTLGDYQEKNFSERQCPGLQPPAINTVTCTGEEALNIYPVMLAEIHSSFSICIYLYKATNRIQLKCFTPESGPLSSRQLQLQPLFSLSQQRCLRNEGSTQAS